MSGLPKLLIIYAIAIPLAILLGFLISAPGMGTVVVIGLLVFLFSIPVLLKHHHIMLIALWNSAFNAFFLPGQPHIWLLMACLSLGISWLNDIMGQRRFIKVPELTRPLLFFGAVVILTAAVRGVGIRALGGTSVGGRGYFYLIGAIVGYFALSAVRIPAQSTKRTVGWFMLSGTTFAASNLIFILGPAFYILYLMFPPEFAISQASVEEGYSDVARIGGLPPACAAVMFFLIARHGLRGLCDWRKPWRLIIFSLAFGAIGFGGFRGAYVLVILILTAQFFAEGLHRTIYLPIAGTALLCALILVISFASKLPLVMQRAVSFLPVQVDPAVAAEAQGSIEWREEMWKTLIPDIPRYLFIGKGYRVDPEDVYLSDAAAQFGVGENYEISSRAGDYHSGPLSVVLSFGIFGTIGYIWLIWAGTKALFRNLKYGAGSLKNINSFLLAFFVAHYIYFLVIFGDIRLDLAYFTGALGMSVCLNGGVAKKPVRRGAPVAAQLVPQAA